MKKDNEKLARGAAIGDIGTEEQSRDPPSNVRQRAPTIRIEDDEMVGLLYSQQDLEESI